MTERSWVSPREVCEQGARIIQVKASSVTYAVTQVPVTIGGAA